MNVTGRRAFGFWKIRYTVIVVSLLAGAAVVGNVSAAAGTPALPQKRLDLRPPDLHGILLIESPHVMPPAEEEDAPAFVIVGAPQLQEMESHTHVPQTGLGSLYWALRHPTRAWRIFLPEQ
ncbi:MAG: hypothetical protein QOG17_1886 [Gammaproteobacteria bacterium]|jgi:hypothetical protein|nr:hypothetical protein [Gammaproteobacteria bacterium]